MQFPFDAEFFKIFGSKLFREEIQILGLAGRDLFISPPSLIEESVVGGLTVGDLLRVWRVVNFIARSFGEHLKGFLESDPFLCMRSLIPTFSDDQFQFMLTEILGAAKASEYRRHLQAGRDRNRDLIYQPLVRAGDFWHIPMNLIASSNFIRNALALSQMRVHGSKDPLGKVLTESFKSKHIAAWCDVQFEYSGKAGDIDCLALIEDCLFFFECKNTLHPCSVAELRSTRQHLEKASTQLRKIDDLVKEEDFLSYLSNKLGHDISHCGRHCCAIVLGHRVLSGYDWDGFEVRSIHELVHYLEEGDAVILGQTIRLRENGPIGASQLIKYLTEKAFHKRIFNSMVLDQRTWRVGSLEVVEVSYVLDAEALSRSFEVELPSSLSSCP
jgi:hypothetical protein